MKAPRLPIGRLAALRAVRIDPLGLAMQAFEEVGDAARIHLGTTEVLVVRHPDLVHHVLVRRAASYGRVTHEFETIRRLFRVGLVTNEGERWRRSRRTAKPAFRNGLLAELGTTMAVAAAQTAAGWAAPARAGTEVDVLSALHRLTLRIASETLFGLHLGPEEQELTEALTTTLVTFNQVTRTLLPAAVPTPNELRFRDGVRGLQRAVDRLIERRRAKEAGSDLLSLLISARDDTGRPLSHRDLRDEVLTFLISGHETTGNSLAWALLALARAPEVAERVAREVDGVVGHRMVAASDLPSLPLTSAVLRETLRLYPPIWVMARSALAPDRVGGFDVTPGTSVYIPPYAVHRHPGFWEQPDAFRPERFAAGRQPSHPLAYIPFGVGRRRCIGERYALMEITLVLATLAQRYRFELAPGHVVEPIPGATLRPGMRLPMRLRIRA